MVDLKFKLFVAGAAAMLVALLTFVRFCGDLSLPAKAPPPQQAAIGHESDVMSQTSGTRTAWKAFLETDARHAGVEVPDPEELARAFSFQVDTEVRALSVGDSIETAGLRLSAEATSADDDPRTLVLVIENLGSTDLAYQVVTEPSISAAACHQREILLHDAMVIPPRRRERRSECIYRDGIRLRITRVETVELPRLSAWYVSRVPPSAVTVDARFTKGHKPSTGAAPCNVMMSQAIRGGLETGSIAWRDLVDFFARHRCDTYQFPQGYKAFTRDDERQLPVM